MPRANKQLVSRLYKQGWDAYPETRRDQNPYDDGTPGNPKASEWDLGWQDHQDLKAMGRNPVPKLPW